MRWLCALLFVIACSDRNSQPQSDAIVVSTDQRGVPRLLQGSDLAPAPAATALASARVHVERLAPKWGVAADALPVLEDVGEVKVRGGTIARLAQVIDGLPVWGRELRLLVRPGGELLTASGSLVATTTPRSPVRFVHDEAGAVARAVEHTYGGASDVVVEQSLTRRMWYPQGGHLVAAWIVDAYTSRAGSTAGDAYRTVIAGDSGRVIAHYSLVAHAEFKYNVFAEAATKHPLDGPIADSTPHPAGAPNGFYPAYLPGPSLITVDSLSATGDPWLASGATETKGNNVDAYADVNAPNGLSNGDFRAMVSAPGEFGYVYDTSVDPLVSTQQQMAAITSLFYVINWLHDFWYDAGFTEAAGNAQLVNFGRGGVEGDPLLAEAQDNALGGSRNNANMATPGDGLSPRMQVFLWSGREDRSLTLSTNRSPATGSASFGPKDFDVTGTLIVGVDGAGPNSNDGCTALTNSVAGKVVVVDRGNCTFKRKALEIQTAGGIGMVLVNNLTSSSPPGMGDDSTITTAITIGMLSVTQAEGATIKGEIAAGTVTATLHRDQLQELDGSLDATLIAHEFGHYLHHRLSICENRMCRALSEGWGDFTALLLLARDGDDLDGAYPFSVYTTQSFSGDPAYFGIRRAPYSTSFAINSLMYRHMADGEPLPMDHPFLPSSNNAEVHNAGEVWAAALWDGYVALQKAGTSFADVRAKMAQYIVAGLLLAPIDASPMETRDAILAAALASSRADHDLLVAAFARRGFGSCAVAPPPDSIDFVGLVESTRIAGNPQVAAFMLEDGCDADGVLDSGETATLKVRVANQGHAALTNVQMSITSALPGVTVMAEPVMLAQLDQFATHDLEVQIKLDGATGALAGDLALTVIADGGCEQTVSIPVAFRLNIDDVDATSAIDTFDTAQSIWEPWTAAWQHVRETPLDGAWHGDDLGIVSDVRLTSPLLHASATEPLVISFQHKHSFEAGNGQFWDGGVIEYSLDDGATWQDVSMLATPGYSGVLTNESGNPLGNRMAFVADNAAWPDVDTVRLDLGMALADQPFRIRFRIGTDAGTGAPGWTVDEVAFQGIVGTPFPTQIADDGVCGPGEEPDDPITSGGGGCCDAGPLRGTNVGLLLTVFALVLRRRRR